jgi:hypothetical protein
LIEPHHPCSHLLAHQPGSPIILAHQPGSPIILLTSPGVQSSSSPARVSNHPRSPARVSNHPRSPARSSSLTSPGVRSLSGRAVREQDDLNRQIEKLNNEIDRLTKAAQKPKLVSPAKPGAGGPLGGIDLDEGPDAPPISEQIGDALRKNATRVIELFRSWDTDGSGTCPPPRAHFAPPPNHTAAAREPCMAKHVCVRVVVVVHAASCGPCAH